MCKQGSLGQAWHLDGHGAHGGTEHWQHSARCSLLNWLVWYGTRQHGIVQGPDCVLTAPLMQHDPRCLLSLTPAYPHCLCL
eukprot:82381-Chlamydomonas_euryale.AAC.8